VKGNRRFRKSERKAMAMAASELLGRKLSVEKIETLPEIKLHCGKYVTTGRDKIVLTVIDK
jgi:hypothetical protein